MKNTKKSMFITTLLMVVLLIVAVSTSTFAWFAANDTVVATQTTMTAATSSDANITIGWDLDDGMGQSIDYANGENMQPMVPELMPLLRDEGDIPEQYVATNIDYDAGIDFSVTEGNYEYNSVPHVNVAYADLDYTILETDLTSAPFDGLTTGTAGTLKRVFRTQVADVEHFVQTTQTIDEGRKDIEYDAVMHEFLEITNDPVEDWELTVTEFETMIETSADYENHELRNTAGDSVEPQAGRRIYLISAIDDAYEIVDIGEEPDTYIEDGVTVQQGEPLVDVTNDYFTIVEELGVFPLEVDGEYYINEADVSTVFGLEYAQEGDKIYQVRAETIDVERSIYTDFEDGFNTGSVDNLDRFRQDVRTATPVTLANMIDSADPDFADTFYIRNDNASGSPAARITVSAEITGDVLAQYLRLSVFYSTSGGTLSYAGTISQSTDAVTHYGTLVNGATANDFLSYEADGTTLEDFVSINPTGNAQIKVVAWYDGLGLDSELSGESTNFILTFEASNIQED